MSGSDRETAQAAEMIRRMEENPSPYRGLFI